jgi:hypothetical protein
MKLLGQNSMGSNMTSETLHGVEHVGGIAPSATFGTPDGGVDGKDDESVRLLVDPDDAAYKSSRMGSRGRGGVTAGVLADLL